ncbi:MAG TPA: Fe-S cluster assembly protein SufD, partial [Acholeplasma sp.]|nr:Fe-S cluster assembly protein SufD [Acholeplasma sp.]
DEAIIEVNPILLIEEYDLKAAGHAATVGKLDEEMLFYLQSRGIPRKDAEKLIINGFIKPVIDEIKNDELKEKFVNLVNSRI